MALLGLVEIINAIFKGWGNIFVASPRYWIYPLQTVICGGLLVRYWRFYQLGPPARPLFTTLVGLVVLLIWISPQEVFSSTPRLEGFNPAVFEKNPTLFWASLSLRFIRLVVVVPIIEEIFWRGFLLRFLIHEDFAKVRFGAFTWASFAGVTVCFGLAHAGPDFWVALITGALYNVVAYRTRSLSSCIVAHSITNLLLGLYILKTGQWGFW
jgi:CAAX prenyl protease-like protein